jgi:hypothetical protein
LARPLGCCGITLETKCITLETKFSKVMPQEHKSEGAPARMNFGSPGTRGLLVRCTRDWECQEARVLGGYEVI